MALLVWNPGWETGDPEIDRQHRTLLGHIEKLFQALVLRQEPGEVAKALAFLSGYVDEHFRMEEELMELSAYPDLGRHRVIHNDLRAQVAELVEKQAKDPAAVSDQVIEFLSDWLLSHIDGHDRALAAHLRANFPGAARI